MAPPTLVVNGIQRANPRSPFTVFWCCFIHDDGKSLEIQGVQNTQNAAGVLVVHASICMSNARSAAFAFVCEHVPTIQNRREETISSAPQSE